MTRTLPDNNMAKLIPGVLVKFKSINNADGWPGGFNESGAMLKELGPTEVGLYVSDWKCSPDYANVLIDETIMLVRKNTNYSLLNSSN